MRKRNTEKPSDDEILSFDTVPTDIAALYIGWSTPTIYRALQEQRAPFGFAAENKETGTWTYNISPGLLVAYKRGSLPTYRLREVQELAVEGIERILAAKLEGLQRVLAAVAV